MNPNHEIIDVSSDSSTDFSDSPIELPPRVFKPRKGCRTKEQARKKKYDVNGSSNPPPAIIPEDLAHIQQEKVTRAFQKALEDAASKFRPIHVPQTTQPSQSSHDRPPKQILGLVCPRLWEGVQKKGVQQSIPGLMDKGKRPI